MNADNIEQMDLNLLKIFSALYEEGGASRAALRLGLTQSAVSAALNRLRILYGDPLFTRTGRGLSPTRRAHELQPLIREALNQCRQSLTLACGLSPGAEQHRTITIGISDDFEIAVGSGLIAAMAQHFPGVCLAFRQTHCRIVAEMLLERDIDLAITCGGQSSRTLSREVVGEGGHACLVDRSSIAPGQIALSLDDYTSRAHLTVSSDGYAGPGAVDELLNPLGLQRRRMAITSHFASLPFLLRGSRAVATLPLHAARCLALHSGLSLQACPLAFPRYPVELGWRTDMMRDKFLAEVRTLISQVLRGYQWQ